MIRVPTSSNPSAVAASAASDGMSSARAAWNTTTGSPTGSAAATNMSARDSRGNASSLRPNVSAIRSVTGTVSEIAKPPAN